ncbi:MAG TPA: hypothetical protein VGY97_09450 [Solirubrobacteraceae bacterium]|nr:hypothetical protein [Solirubrobacteraceae bacterium]
MPNLAATAALSVVLVLAGCGGSSSSSHKAAATPSGASGATGSRGPGGRFIGNPARRAAIQACLRKQGITLPTRPGGATGPPGTAGRGGPTGPGGTTGRRFGAPPFRNPAFVAAARKCGLVLVPGRFGAGRPFGTFFRAAVGRYVTCVRQHGFPLPNPSTTGPPFKRGQFNTSDPRFVAANAKCQGLLPGGGAGGPPGG